MCSFTFSFFSHFVPNGLSLHSNLSFISAQFAAVAGCLQYRASGACETFDVSSREKLLNTSPGRSAAHLAFDL